MDAHLLRCYACYRVFGVFPEKHECMNPNSKYFVIQAIQVPKNRYLDSYDQKPVTA
jgi:rRNA maturation endonuclease Nob1